MTTDNERITAYIKPGYKEKLKEYAAMEDRSLSYITDKVICEFIDKLIAEGVLTPIPDSPEVHD